MLRQKDGLSDGGTAVRRKSILASIVFAMVAAACGGGDSDDTSTGTGTAGRADPNAEVRIAGAEDTWPDQGEGVKSTTFAYPPNFNVYDPLIYLASDYTLKPGLAERWEFIEPGTWRFHLRRNVTFHSGKPFTADDVMWTWAERQMEAKVLTTITSTLGPDSVKKIDDFTVDFTPRVTNNRIPEQIVHPEAAIVPRGNHFDTLPADGTGPFKVVDYKRKESVTLERNDAYWGPKPQVRRLSVRFLPDAQTRIEALRSGQVDFVMDLPPDATRSIESDPNLRVVRSKPGRNHLIYINKSGQPPHELGADKAVRQAVSLAIDRKAYTETVFEGNADPGRWMAPESVLGSSASLVAPVPFAPAQARTVLENAGWSPGPDGIRTKDGKRLSLTLLGTSEIPESAGQFLQAQLKDVGIEVAIKKTPDTATRNTLYRAGDYTLDLEPPNQNDGNPAFLPVLRMHSKQPNTTQFAPGGQFDVLAERSLAAKTTAEVQQLSAQMMKILINDEFIVAPVAGIFRIYGMNKSVSFTDPHPSQTNQTWFSLSKSAE